MNLPTKLFHYSKRQIEALVPDYHSEKFTSLSKYHKPIGLWLSIEDYPDDQTWKTWCEAEEFRLEGLEHVHSITLKPNAKILHLWNIDQLEEFSLKYAREHVKSSWRSDDDPLICEIDWPRVQTEYDGIFIAPHSETYAPMNSKTFWHWGWDCSSGCIWNYDCIEEFKCNETKVGKTPNDL